MHSPYGGYIRTNLGVGVLPKNTWTCRLKDLDLPKLKFEYMNTVVGSLPLAF